VTTNSVFSNLARRMKSRADRSLGARLCRFVTLSVALGAPTTVMLPHLTCAAQAAGTNVYQSQFSGEHTAPGSFRPYALATGATGNLFVADIEHGVVDVFNPAGTELITEITGAETKAGMNGEAISVFGVAVGPSGDVYVADIEHHIVYEFEPTGVANYKLIHEIEGTATKAGFFEPYSLAIGPHEELFVGDLGQGVVDELDASSTEVRAEITASEPLGIAVNPSGNVYTAAKSAGVVDEFEAVGTGNEYDLKGEISGAATPQGSFEPERVALAANNDLYVSDVAHSLVDRLSGAGAYECQLDGSASEPNQCGGDASATPQGSFEPTGLAIGPTGTLYIGDTAHELVDLFSPASEPATSQWMTKEATDLTTTAATLNGTVDPEGQGVGACDFEYGTSTAYGQTISCEQTSGQIGEGTSPVAISAEVSGLEPGTKYYFRVAGEGVQGKGHGDEESFTTQFKPPAATIRPVTGVDGHCATFNGEVDPEGATTTYRFEDSTDGTTWTALEQAGVAEGTTAVPVTQEVCDLSGSSTYHVRLFAESSGGHVTSGEERFPTPASAPQLAGVGASVLGSQEATLYATIYPEGQATTYRFEYGTTTAYGTIMPAGEDDAGTIPGQDSQRIANLSAGTIYHYRVVATNGTGSTDSGDETFTTSLVASEARSSGSGLCPNEALRGESDADSDSGVPYSSELPDCRAYEQATPPFKGVNGVDHGTYCAICGDSVAVESVSVKGAPLLVRSLVPLGNAVGGTDGEVDPGSYELARTASGWVTTALTPAASKFAIATWELTSEDSADAEIWAAATPEQSIDAEDFYLHEPNGTFVDIGPLAPPSATAGPPHGAFSGTAGIDSAQRYEAVVGASGDLSDVVYQLDSPQAGVQVVPSLLWPGDETVEGERPSLYEYVGTGHSGDGSDRPALVGVDNNGIQISQCGIGLGGDDEQIARPIHNGVSAAGSTVFFTAQAGGCLTGAAGPPSNQVYARVGLPGARQATVNLAGGSGCTASTSCNVTSAVTFQGASSDGSRVFVTAAQAELVPGDPDATTALYECELPGDAGATLPASGRVDACPVLKALSLTGTSEGANVQSVLAVSEEGSRVYFTAKGVLTNNPDGSLPAGHQTAQTGENNLYVWQALGDGQSSGKVSFIATLPSARPDEAEATPDGDYLVFTTTADLTSDDTSTAAQAFRYDAITDGLIRISVGQNGVNQDGNTTADAATLASDRDVSGTPGALPRSVSENGAYVAFQSSAALTPQVKGGINNVYEWHEGDVSLISDGTDTSEHAGLIGIDASGENIFFVTADKLVGQDTDEDYDVYDARIDGGFPAPTPVPSCTGEACQGALSSPFAPPAPGSTGTPAIGNAPPPVGTAITKRKPKSLTNPQKLAKALNACHRDKRRRRRQACERAAGKHFAKKNRRPGAR
jgi:hypothetical protein